MNIDLHYYTSCYNLAAYITALNSNYVNEIILSDKLKAKTYWFYSNDDIQIGDVSEFIIEFYLKERLIDRITFNTNYKKAKLFEKSLYKGNTLESISLVKALEPSIKVKLMKHKPNLTKEEQAIVISKANELEYFIENRNNNQSTKTNHK